METTTIAIIGLVIAVIALSIALVSKRKTNTDNTGISSDNEIPGIVLPDSSVLSFSDADEIILSDTLGQEIIFKRPDEISNIEYKEITVSGKGRGTGTRFLVIEPAKGEYKHVFGNTDDVSVYGTNQNVTPLLRINSFSFPDEIHVLEQIDRLVEHGMAIVFKNESFFKIGAQDIIA